MTTNKATNKTTVHPHLIAAVEAPVVAATTVVTHHLASVTPTLATRDREAVAALVALDAVAVVAANTTYNFQLNYQRYGYF